MKYIVHFSIIVLALIVAGLILGIYYFQDTSSEYKFVSEIPYSEIDMQTSFQQDYGMDIPEEFVREARVQLGELNIENQGIFSYIYSPPNFIGCLNFEGSSNLYNSPVMLQYTGQKIVQTYDYLQNTKLEVKSGQKKTYQIVGVYNGGGYLKDFSKGKLKNIVIYKLSSNENNPLSEEYYYAYYDCTSLQLQDLTPEKVIPFV